MRQYLDLVSYVLENGEVREDRTGTGTIGVFGTQTRYNLRDGFPAITTKKLYFKGVVVELLWFLRGDTNIKYLIDHGVHIWDDDAFRYNKVLCPDYPYDKDHFLNEVKSGKEFSLDGVIKYKTGDLGSVYGKQWRRWGGGIDQVQNVIDGIKQNPYSRRHIINAWNPINVDNCALPPCHVMAQFYVSNNKLSCHMIQRSQDIILGCSYNIASYALLTHMIAQICNLGVGELIISVGDAHIYLNHIDQAKEQLKREPKPLPQLQLNTDIKNINDFKIEDIKLINYDPHPTIKAPLSVGL